MPATGRPVKKRVLFFYEHSTDFPLHRQGLLYNTDGGIDKVPVPVVPQVNDPVQITPEYVYSEFWIRPTFNVLSTDRALFDITAQRMFECLDGQGRLSYFKVYTERQGIPSAQRRFPNSSIQRLIHRGQAPRGDVLVTKHSATDQSLVDIEVWDRIITNDIMRHNKLPHYIDVAILEVCGFTEWTMLKRVSQFHYRNISTFIDARFLYQLERYVEPPLLIFAPNETQEAWFLFAEFNDMQASVTALPVVFEDFCSSYMEIKGLRNTRIRVLFGKTKSALPLILACTETIGYGFLNSKGLYLGYPLDVLKKVCGGRWAIVQELAIHGGQWALLQNFNPLFKCSRRNVAGR
ncbi:uncharacterized protein C8R40DRAFT_1066087 [Lentinula edodes]|uniref:uncharacterized protein n=1 Tax=Lentinula edodes TaxID=5353 RepID=UPI001E8E6187|nr:uncharacterized protein C8R40DRAFT_1066087 [Lentinula edodes]KAH7879933.1 hypothetical protein C8R40DRAFT_1066087 [Lentinula edodes]